MRSPHPGLLPDWLGIGLLTASLLSVSAQPLPIRSKVNSASIPQLSAESQLVLINATVVDSKDRLLLDLQPYNFQIFEDKREQQLTTFALEETPVSVGIVFDVSRSIKRVLPEMRAAVEKLVASLRVDDETFLITFNDRAEVASDFGAAPASILKALAGREAKGGTALLDTLVLALQHMKQARERRRALVVFSDAEELDSRYSWGEVIRIVREANVRIYPFVLAEWFEESQYCMARMTEIANESGGRSFRIRKSKEFVETVEKLDIHNQYVLGYVPSNKVRDGKYRRVTLKMNGAPKNLKAYWRRGYFSP